MLTLMDLPLELFTLVVSTYVQDTSILEVIRARAVSRTFATAITEELLFNGAKIVDHLKRSRVGRYAFFHNKRKEQHEFLTNNAVTVLYHYVQRPLRTKPLLPVYIGALADDLIQGTINAVGKLQYTRAEITEIRDTFVHELCHTCIELNPGQIWLDLAYSPGHAKYSRSAHKSLAVAACVGHIEAMHYFLNLGADPFELEHDSFRNPFKAAACTGKVDALRLLFASVTANPESPIAEKISSPVISTRLKILQDAIEIAVKGHHHESALLIKDFALTQCTSANVANFNQKCMDIAVRNGDVQFLESLFKSDRSIIALGTTQGRLMTIKHVETACKMGHVELIRYLLKTNIINPTMFRSDTEVAGFNLLSIALRHSQCRIVDLFYETGAKPLLQHLSIAFESLEQKAFVMIRHLIESKLVLHEEATVTCNNLAIFTLHKRCGQNSKLLSARVRNNRVMAILFLATELKKQRLLDLKQDLRGLFELCESVLPGHSTKVSNIPLPFVEMARCIRRLLKRKAPMFQPQSTRVLRSRTPHSM